MSCLQRGMNEPGLWPSIDNNVFFIHQEMTSIFQTHPLAALIAQEVDTSPRAWGQSERPKQTVAPLASVLSSKNVDLEFTTRTKSALPTIIHDILGGRWKGKSVIVSWAHQQVPDLVKALGVSAEEVPGKWPGKRFDVTWVVKPGKDGGRPTFEQYAQRLMYGDKDSVIELGGAGHGDETGDE
ncbi:hypothetical protein HK097_001589 [Rhizophlyctis rosea]|uniref:Uncharacterized protein n=1 Tax=Rhizophlyctis rosea TaxID=64517 RepID=A0AAD5X0Q0_9FUNG|nr:hypothetical protein HK097_001589 [Rhizophlyctis rosea]